MTSLLAFILFLSLVAIVAIMFVQAKRGTVDLLSVRNFFMLGIIIFQMISGILSLSLNEYGQYYVGNPTFSGSIFVGILFTFLLFFSLSYQQGWGVKRLPWRLPRSYPTPIPATIIPLAAVLLGTGIFCRFVVARNVPVFGVLADIMAIGFVAAAAGLAMWVWAPRLWNPAVAIPAAAIILLAIVALIFQNFGRRDVVSVLVAVLFAGYHSQWRHLGFGKMAFRLSVIAAIGLVFLSAFTTVRFAAFKRGDVGSMLSAMGDADVKAGLADVASGQFAAANSMWLIETRPKTYPFDPFHSAITAITHPIPRIIWREKQIGLGLEMVAQGRIRGVESGYTVGPGIVGHIWNDNPILALIPYALFLGLFARFLDEHVRVHPGNPFVIIPVIVGVGEIVGLARGELGMFLFRAVAAMVAAWVGLRIAWAFLGLFSGSVAAAEYTSTEDPDEWHEDLAYAETPPDGPGIDLASRPE